MEGETEGHQYKTSEKNSVFFRVCRHDGPRHYYIAAATYAGNVSEHLRGVGLQEESIKNLVLPMPTDCEINWREHRQCIKGRTIFGMTLKSSSKHHPLNMRLLLITLTCLAACLAAPEQKQKRDILPGDPRYGTDHHHHHHNHPSATVVESTKAVGGYAYSIPDSSFLLPQGLPQDVYGPPAYQPGLPLKNDYLAPVIDNARASLLPTIATPHVTKTIINPPIAGLRQVVSTTQLRLPLEKVVQPVPALPLSTSYGTPVVGHLKTLGTHTHYKPALNTVKTEIYGQTPVSLPKPAVKVIEHAPLVQGVSHVNAGIRTLPSVTTVDRKFPTLDTPTLFTNDQATLNGGIHAGYAGLKAVNIEEPLTSLHGLKSVHVEAPVASVQVTKNIHPLPLVNEYSGRAIETVTALPPVQTHLSSLEPLPTLHSVTATPIQHVHHPVHTAPALPSIKSVETLTPIQPTVGTIAHPIPTIQPVLHAVPPILSIKSVESQIPVHQHVHTAHHAPLTSIRTVQKTLTPLQPAVTAIAPPVPTVHSTVHPVHPLPAIKTVETLPPVHTVHPVQPITSVHTAHHLPPVGHLETVSTLSPAINSIGVLPSVQPAHAFTEVVKTKTPLLQKNLHVHVQKGPVSDFLSGLGVNLPNFPSLPSLPQLPSFPSLPQYPPIVGGVTTVSPIEVSTPSNVYENRNLESITVDNPLFRDDTVPNHIIPYHDIPSNVYIQPTDKDGGYIY